jgi:hypothetical protein
MQRRNRRSSGTSRCLKACGYRPQDERFAMADPESLLYTKDSTAYYGGKFPEELLNEYEPQ